MDNTISLIKSRILSLMKDADKLGAESVTDVKQAVSAFFEDVEEDNGDE